ncbi:MAG: HAD family hydrolase [Planctomycetota bacterium]|nr:HAD family hydrolase [Planctomycetota bacterium]
MSGQPGLFLDRDGVINHYIVESVRSPEQFSYYDGTPDAMKLLGQLDCPIVVVTNQSAIGRGWTDPGQVDEIHHRLCQDALSWGATISSVEYCPHLPDEGCACRKPGTQMFERAARTHGIDLASSVMVGDSPCDMEAAERLDMTRILVATGRGESASCASLEVDARVVDLEEAARWIQQHRKMG